MIFNIHTQLNGSNIICSEILKTLFEIEYFMRNEFQFKRLFIEIVADPDFG
jgi:hypothetical protein